MADRSIFIYWQRLEEEEKNMVDKANYLMAHTSENGFQEVSEGMTSLMR